MTEWTCHVCGDTRTDAMIGVLKSDISAQFDLPPGTVGSNVRHCLDRPECVEGAPDVKHVKEAP